MLDAFRGNPSVLAYYPDAQSKPKPLQLSQPLTPADFARGHLSGKNCLGFYPMLPDTDSVYSACVDLDNHDGKNGAAQPDALRVYNEIKRLGYSPLLEISQSGTGAHVWLLFDAPCPAVRVRSFLKSVLADLNLTAEIYPAQDSVSHLEAGIGNMVRYPLWNKSHFEDASRVVQDPIALLTTHAKESPEDLPEATGTTILPSHYQTDGLPARVASLLDGLPDSLLTRRWTCDVGGMKEPSRSRSSLVMAIATELVRYNLPTPEIEAAIRYWCAMNGYAKSEKWIERTVAKAYCYAPERQREKNTGALTFKQMAHEQLDYLAQGGEEFIPFGVKTVDDSIGGFAIGEYVLITARTGHGKTALALHCLEEAARHKHAGLFLSLEMSKTASFRRLLPRMGIKVTDMDSYKLSDIHKAIERYYADKSPIYFADCLTTGRHISDVEKVVETYVRESGVRMVVVDYQELVESDSRSMFESQNDISKRLSRLAHKLGVIVICLVQMRRDAEEGEDTMPALRHLKYAGEQDADVVLAGKWLSRTDQSCAKDKYVIYALKVRNRETKEMVMEVKFDYLHQRFEQPDGRF